MATNSKDLSSKNLNTDSELDKSSRKESISHKVGDKVERAGEKLKNAGAQTLGNAVYKAGNKLEHASDHKKTNR